MLNAVFIPRHVLHSSVSTWPMKLRSPTHAVSHSSAVFDRCKRWVLLPSLHRKLPSMSETDNLPSAAHTSPRIPRLAYAWILHTM